MAYEPIVFDQGAWSRHTHFAYDFVRELAPKKIVELGTHRGESYFSFCHSVKDHALSTVCYAVDTWQGDPQAGFYGDDIFANVHEINSRNFAHFSYLVRSKFADASVQFSKESIDLLHIDGLHTYEAVKEDFDTWIDKVSSGGVILFHDVMVRHGDFGVWKLWEELQSKYKTFTFNYGFGLGVLFKNPEELPQGKLLSGLLSDSEESRLQIHEHYTRCYEQLSFKLSFGIASKKLREYEERLSLLEQQNQIQQETLRKFGRRYRVFNKMFELMGK